MKPNLRKRYKIYFKFSINQKYIILYYYVPNNIVSEYMNTNL